MLDLGDVTAIVMNSNLLMRQRADAILRTTAAQWDKEQSIPIAASIPTKARSENARKQDAIRRGLGAGPKDRKLGTHDVFI